MNIVIGCVPLFGARLQDLSPGNPMTNRASFDLLRICPWLHLGRVFSMALDFRKLCVGGVALLILGCGNWAINTIGGGNADSQGQLPTVAAFRPWPWQPDGNFGVLPVGQREQLTDPDFLRERTTQQFCEWSLVLQPINSVWEPGRQIVRGDPDTWVSVRAWLQLAWALLVWSFFGTVLTRMAAVQFARDERPQIMACVKFAASRFLWVLSAPLLALSFIAGLWGLIFLGGLPGKIAVVGPLVVGSLWILALILAFAIMLLLAGLALGWPLMVATIGTQGSEGFDGFSRAFDYLYSRPWQFLWSIVVAVVLGVLSILFVSYVAAVVTHLAYWPIAASWESDPLENFLSCTPRVLGGTVGKSSAAAWAVGGWMGLMATLLAGFVPAFFWSAVTTIYFLLRQSVDGIDLDEVWLPENNEEVDSLVQLAGMAASEQPPVERPPHGDPPANDAAE